MSGVAIFDIEANGLLDTISEVHCISVYDPKSDRMVTFSDNPMLTKYSLKQGLKYLSTFDTLVGHNIISYDIKAIKKVLGKDFQDKRLVDTLTLSQLLYPDIDRALGVNAPHSLEAWGVRLGYPKIEFNDWQYLTRDMIEYCEQDVTITYQVYQKFIRDIKKDKETLGVDWAKSIKLEFECARICADQEETGWKFDVEYAEKLVDQIDRQISVLDKVLSKGDWPYSVENKGEHTPYVSKKMDSLIMKNIKPALWRKHWFRDGNSVNRKNILNAPFTLLDEESGKWVEITDLNDEKGMVASRFEKIFLANNQVPEGPFTLVDLHTFNYQSNVQLVDLLLERGWTPSSYTEKNNPQIVEGDLPRILGKLGEALERRGDLTKVRSLFKNPKDEGKGLLNYVRPDGRIPAGCVPQGTPTGRARHSKIVNIGKVNKDKETGDYLYYPKGSVPYGTEQREVFIAEDGWSIVGADASGLELRMLGHYMDDAIFLRELLTGDIHTHNQKAAGLPTRDNAKTFIYGFIYGAGNEKIGSIVGGDSKEGARLKQKFLDSLPKLRDLMEHVKTKAQASGYLIGLDGRILRVRENKEHAALNLLLQSAGAIVMKVAMVILHKLIKSKCLDEHAHQLGWFHDEWQWEVREGYEKQVGEAMVESIVKAGEVLGLRCPLDGEWASGKSWRDTH